MFSSTTFSTFRIAFAGLVFLVFHPDCMGYTIHEDVDMHFKLPAGWLDVSKLRRAIQEVESLPDGNGACDLRSPDVKKLSLASRVKFDKKRKICEARQDHLKAAYKRAHRRLNRIWMPAITNASNLGDPVAEVILRSCGTTPLLERDGIASDCSILPTDREIARKRLEGTNFEPALHAYSAPPLNYGDCSKGTDEQREKCFSETEVAYYQRTLGVMNTGYFGVSHYWNECHIRWENEKNDLLAETCWFHFCMSRYVATDAEWSYSFDLSLTDNTFPTGGDTRRPVCNTRNDRSPLRDPDFQSKLIDKIDDFTHRLEKNIENDLRKDPRWGVFLVTRNGDRPYSPNYYRTVERYISAITGRHQRQFAYQTLVLDSLNKHRGSVAGVAREMVGESRQAFVFVLRKQNGLYKEVARSKVFDLGNPPYRVEPRNAKSQEKVRFAIQFSRRSSCGKQTDIYRFKKFGATWLVTGHDTLSPICSDNGTVSFTERYSANLLTGKVIVERREKGKPRSTRVSTMSFPQFSLTDFPIADFR